MADETSNRGMSIRAGELGDPQCILVSTIQKSAGRMGGDMAEIYVVRMNGDSWIGANQSDFPLRDACSAWVTGSRSYNQEGWWLPS